MVLRHFAAAPRVQWVTHDSVQGMYGSSWPQCGKTVHMQLTCIDIDAKVYAIPSLGCMLLPELV